MEISSKASNINRQTMKYKKITNKIGTKNNKNLDIVSNSDKGYNIQRVENFNNIGVKHLLLNRDGNIKIQEIIIKG